MHYLIWWLKNKKCTQTKREIRLESALFKLIEGCKTHSNEGGDSAGKMYYLSWMRDGKHSQKRRREIGLENTVSK